MRFMKSVLATCLVASAVAQTLSFSATVELTTAAEIAGGTMLADEDAAATSFGVAEIEFSGLSNTLTWRINVFGLSGPVVLAHFHGPAPTDDTADVTVTIADGVDPQDDDVFMMPDTGSADLTEEQVDDLIAGMWYINIHTEANMAGELRGQILPILTIAESFDTTILLTPEAEAVAGAPLAVASNGIGQAEVRFDAPSSTLSWVITYEGLSSMTTAAHFHGPARETGTAGVEVPITGANFQSGLVGSFILEPQQIADLEAGLWYVNVHTQNNAGGELRGQVIAQAPPVPQQQASIYQASVSLSPDAVDAGGQPLDNPSNASGTAIVQLSLGAPRYLSWHVSFNDLTSSTLFAHFHGPAGPNANGGVQITISEGSFQSPHTGIVMIAEEQTQQLLDGLWYVNIHTDLNGMGELRGQLENFDMVLVDVGNTGAGPGPGAEVDDEDSASKVSYATGLVISAVAALLLK